MDDNIKIKNKVQLITYPDSMDENLRELNFILDKFLKEVMDNLYILPFYPSYIIFK